jgi:hypothetical protein
VNGGTFVDINNVVPDTCEYPPLEMPNVDKSSYVQRRITQWPFPKVMGRPRRT